MNNQSTKLLALLSQLQGAAQTMMDCGFKEGYLMGIRHAAELVRAIDQAERYRTALEAIERNQ
jgi:hypothetical protein